MITCKIGLDSISFIVRIEECFGIFISDEDAEKIDTVGDLFSYVRARVAAGSSTECMTAKAFYRLRRMLMEEFRCERKRIIASMPLRELFPRETRRQQLAKLGRSLGVWLPRWMPGASRYVRVESLWLFLLVAIVLGMCKMYLLAAIFAVGVLPAGMIWYRAKQLDRYQTVGDLAPVVLEQHFKEFTAQGASDQQVWESIVSILCSEVGMDRSHVTRDLRFGDIPGDL